MTNETILLLKDIADINLAFQHKPFNPDTIQHRQFLQNYWEKTIALQEKYSFLDFSAEIDYFQSGKRNS
jgi:hypothetical protein